MLIDVTAPVEPVNFHNKMYRGDILCFRQLEPMLELVATFREFAAEAAAPHAPVALHRTVTHEEAIERLDRYRSGLYTTRKFSVSGRRFWRRLAYRPST